jgi:hypothetical protein
LRDSLASFLRQPWHPLISFAPTAASCQAPIALSRNPLQNSARAPDSRKIVSKGAQRAGTTWLDRRLRAHPDIYLPERRKELHYFDRYYERGIEWYESFFPEGEDAQKYRKIGEITPKYLFDPMVPTRIQRDLPGCRMIAILRNPVDRAYSQYALAVRDDGEQRSFWEFTLENPDVLERGHYAQQLKRYYDLFPSEQLLVFIFNEVMSAPEDALQRMASFLDVDPTPFSRVSTSERINASYRPRYPRVRAAVRRVGEFLRDRDLDWFVNFAKEIGVPHMFGNAGGLPPLTAEVKERLAGEFESDVTELERLIGKDLSAWKETRGVLS